jgi:hypothetical protein
MPWMVEPNQKPFIFYGQPLYKVEGHQKVHPLEPFENLLSESKIQEGACLAPLWFKLPLGDFQKHQNQKTNQL